MRVLREGGEYLKHRKRRLLVTLLMSPLHRMRKGRLGERLVTNLLRQLPDTYHLVNDVVVPGSGGNIDHVVIGPCGVVVIETKRLAGKIRCDGDRWYVNGRLRGSISAQANRGAAALRKFLADRHPEIPSRFVRSITVFTHPLCRLQIHWARATVVRYSELLHVLLEMSHQRRIPSELAQRLAETLAQSQHPLAS